MKTPETRVQTRDSCLKPGTLRGTNPVFAALSSQNRFQALLDEIIQQEEREMEQVKTFSRKINAIEAPRLLSSSPGCHITCALIWLSFTSPDGKFHLQSCSICQRLGLFLVAMAAGPPTVLCPLFVWTNQGSRLMRKDMLIIIHLPPQLHPRAAGHQSRILFFSSPQLASLQEQLDSLVEK